MVGALAAPPDRREAPLRIPSSLYDNEPSRRLAPHARLLPALNRKDDKNGSQDNQVI